MMPGQVGIFEQSVSLRGSQYISAYPNSTTHPGRTHSKSPSSDLGMDLARLNMPRWEEETEKTDTAAISWSLWSWASFCLATPLGSRILGWGARGVVHIPSDEGGASPGLPHRTIPSCGILAGNGVDRGLYEVIAGSICHPVARHGQHDCPLRQSSDGPPRPSTVIHRGSLVKIDMPSIARTPSLV
jgi:hypothetical protein